MSEPITVKEKHSDQEYTVHIEKNKSIKIDCLYKNHIKPKQTSVSFTIADQAEYDSYNYSYFGPIISITEKTVSILPQGATIKRRLTLEEFCKRNWDFNLDQKKKENNEISNML